MLMERYPERRCLPRFLVDVKTVAQAECEWAMGIVWKDLQVQGIPMSLIDLGGVRMLNATQDKLNEPCSPGCGFKGYSEA